MSRTTDQLLKMAQANFDKMLHEKQAFIPMPGGQPEAPPQAAPPMLAPAPGGAPMDPAMMGGDPAAMGMDPAAMGTDPAMMEQALMAEGAAPDLAASSPPPAVAADAPDASMPTTRDELLDMLRELVKEIEAGAKEEEKADKGDSESTQQLNDLSSRVEELEAALAQVLEFTGLIPAQPSGSDAEAAPMTSGAGSPDTGEGSIAMPMGPMDQAATPALEAISGGPMLTAPTQQPLLPKAAGIAAAMKRLKSNR